ncbi:hypothetical protein DAPPUDRAFT_111192 [Daphnia pulex]|uniref:Uncharacterized protein n=1 Tax=Daphnia pulex TaxID=6669 RepID=E9H8H1_DAPPU|nr:hypothetical protein DAPPUDRAFT_111192 [Daphnia pulex]|eukprot:EFX71980.1 hypothetical protein DAPPUDRAFT_111192 [Daphnia pulex]
MKNVKSVKQADGKRLNVQKRLLMVNIDELHRDYKKKLTSDRLRAFGLSVFESLRPPNVITVGSSGTHSVCVCVYHQNVKLRLAAIHITDERYHFMDKLVCNVYNKDCMMTRCASCPGTDILRQFLSDLADEEDEQISYKKWTQTDGSKLETITEEKEEFIESLVKLISNLTKHHYIELSERFFRTEQGKRWHRFLRTYAIQGYYWMNDSATLLPFMAYMKNENGSAFNVSLCLISDHSTHDTLAVHAVLRPVLTHLKSINPLLKKPFASCHGKSACDGIGGTLKRLARENVDIKTFYVSSDSVQNNAATIERRMEQAYVVQGLRSLHCHVPLNSFQLKASPLSGIDSDFKVCDVLPDQSTFTFETCHVNDFIACIYESNGLWGIAQICTVDEENNEFQVKFMSPDGESGFMRGYKPTNDFAMVSLHSVLLKIDSLRHTTRLPRILKINQEEYNEISVKYTNRMSDGF